VWHRAAAHIGPDEDLVDDLERAAARAQRRGAPAGTAAALERAADLTSDDTRRGSLLLQAADLENEIGRNDVALQLLRKARTFDLDSRMRLRASYLSEILEGGWSGAKQVAAFAEVAEELSAAGEQSQALDALEAVALRSWWANPEQATRDRIVAVAEHLGLPAEDPRLLAILAGADPVNRGRVVLERSARASELAAGDPVAMATLANAVASVWAPNLSLPLCTMALDGLRAQGRLAVVARVLVVQAWSAVHLADARIATPAAAEAARLSEETGQPRWVASALLAQATMAAERGDPIGAEQLAARAEAVLLPMGANPMLSMVQFARGRAAVAQARYSDAYEQLRRVFDRGDIAHHPFVGGWAVADFVDAAVHGGGSLDAARETLAEYERIAAVTQGPLLRAQLAFVRPLIAPASEAEPLFQTALQDELPSWPCYRGRLLLAYGSWLRRQRRAADSRVPLRAAAEAFDALGFVETSRRARQELRASGETGRPRVVEAWNELSPQELQIARMAAAGMTNRQIGEKLYLSHRTIGSHLYRVFPKLGITSRAELRDVLESAVGA
jgi:DNA-binding CsgD family transcriptional regulator